ncbi:MAG: hypothetical protein GC190_06475 [Alphaproteobacteria bacterium]|nr:hypothetical protein [Alphaproteobacteria bacterium]
MGRVQSWMMWVAGMLAILGSINVVSLPLSILFVQVNVLMPVVGILCFAVAYVSYEQAHKNTTLNWILWATGCAAFLTAVLSFVPLVDLKIVLPFLTINGLMLILGFVCLLIAYLKTWRR